MNDYFDDYQLIECPTEEESIELYNEYKDDSSTKIVNYTKVQVKRRLLDKDKLCFI